MKKLIILFFAVFIANLCHAQDSMNFKIIDGEVVWQKVYESKDSINQIIKRLNVLTAIIKDLDADYKGAGFSRGMAPMFLISDKITGSVTIDFKDGKYRATIKHMKMENKIATPISKIGETEPIETYALKKKNTIFKSGFLTDPAIILDYTFNKIFEKKEMKKEDENW